MRRLGLLLLIVLAGSTATPAQGARRFDSATAARVYAVALGFIAPRALDPVTVPALTLWGLHGLTALDPDLVVDRVEGVVRLLAGGRALLSVKVPIDEAPLAWAALATRICAVAWDASATVRRAGTQGVIEAFFGDLLNHLDPYSRYLAPVEAAATDADRNGEAGIGVTLAARGREIVVGHAISDGPAALAGIVDGTRILAVDGAATSGATVADVEAWIAGDEDTEVRLRVRARAGGRRGARTVTLTRARVPEENVFSRRDHGVLIVRITEFTSRTASRLDAALEDAGAERSRPVGIVLDLRDNRGGLVREAAETADALLPGGVVMVTRGRDPAADRIWRSEDGELDAGSPVIVLVDGRTASAAEILAAALADRGRAVVVGSSTLGKGLVQTITRLPDGGELVLTWSQVLAPRGWPIQGLGVLPQVCTSLGGAALTDQLAELAGGVGPMEARLARARDARDARAPMPEAEILAIREACPAAEGSDLDLSAARRLIADPVAYAAALLAPMDAGSRRASDVGQRSEASYNPAAATDTRRSASGRAP